jgi:UDP-N-acetyl-2-amino-2-deoxyglucuronate dehydrogenase
MNFTNKKKIKVAIIGAGRISEHHLKAIKKNRAFELVAICDLDKEKAHNFGKKYKVPFYTNYNQMLIQKKIDIVAIMTPSGSHYEHCKDILLKYKKNLIIEKPTFLKPSQVKEIYIIANKNKNKIFPVFQNRFNKSIQKIKKEINKNKIGKINIVNIRVRWCRTQKYYELSPWRGTFSHDGGVLTNQGIHHIDLLRYLIGEVTEVYSKMETLGVNVEVEDTALALFKFKNNAVGSMEITTSARPRDFEASISILGSKGMVQIGGLAVNEIQIYSPDQKICSKYSEKIPDAYGFGHFELYNQIYLSMIKNRSFIISGEDCFKTILLLNAFYVSNEKKKNIVIKNNLESKKLGRKNEEISKLYRNQK